MKQSFDLKLGQHLTITPQLQQAIRLLQLSSIELQQEVQEALESNPLLEEQEGAGEDNTDGAEGERLVGTEAAPEPALGEGENISLTATDRDMETRIENDEAIPEDADWSDGFDLPITTASRPAADDLPDIEARSSAPQTLREHLIWQMQLTPFSPTDRRIAEAIIDTVNEDGYLTLSLEEIQQALAPELNVEADEIEAVLHQIQNFEPLGVAARDLAECLRLQLRARDDASPVHAIAVQIACSENLAALGARDYAQLKRATRANAEDLQLAIELIQRLNPRPGTLIQSSQAAYVTPDIIVRKVRGVWRADLNNDVAPRLRINRQYERLIHRGDSSAQNRYLQDQLQQARWLIKSLASRNDTLLKVARTIVDRQRAFFDHGPEAMKPLVLHDIAEAVGMHESTISRVTTNKYMLTPRGIFELKYFFSSHVATADGGTCSATAIRSIIKKMIEAESTDKPISDSTIAEILAEQGIHVARRTVAKYREFMNIPPSSQRRSLNVRK